MFVFLDFLAGNWLPKNARTWFIQKVFSSPQFACVSCRRTGQNSQSASDCRAVNTSDNQSSPDCRWAHTSIMTVLTPTLQSANIHVQPVRVRSHSVSTSYPRHTTATTQYCHSCDKKLAGRASLILHNRQLHSGTVFIAAATSESHDKTTVASGDNMEIKPKTKLSTFSFRSRASSVSSFSSASSGSSSSSSPSSQSSINTELFWNKYRRRPEDSFMINMMRRANVRRFISRDKKYLSSQDLHSREGQE